jgi:hypothetical protein
MTSNADLAVLVLGRADDVDREALLDRVRVAAAEAPDRVDAVERTRRSVAEIMLVRLNRAGFVVTWADLPWAGASPLRVEDRVWLSLAAQDMAVAELLADRLSADDRDQLRAGWDLAASMPGLGMTGVPTIRGPIRTVATVALVLAGFAIGAMPFALLLAVPGRRRWSDERV